MNNLTKIEKDTFEIHNIAADHDLTNQSIDEIERISPTNFDVPIWMTVREFSDLTGSYFATHVSASFYPTCPTLSVQR